MRAGFLEQRSHGPVRDALLTDTAITERQKQVLLDIYESFRRENSGGGAASGSPDGGAAVESPGPISQENEKP